MIQDIPIGGATLRLILPSNVSLTVVSASPLQTAPRTTVNMFLDILESDVRIAVQLGTGIAWSTEPGEGFAFDWHGRLPLGPDYQYRVNVFIANYATTAIRWIITAWIEED